MFYLLLYYIILLSCQLSYNFKHKDKKTIIIDIVMMIFLIAVELIGYFLFNEARAALIYYLVQVIAFIGVIVVIVKDIVYLIRKDKVLYLKDIVGTIWIVLQYVVMAKLTIIIHFALITDENVIFEEHKTTNLIRVLLIPQTFIAIPMIDSFVICMFKNKDEEKIDESKIKETKKED